MKKTELSISQQVVLCLSVLLLLLVGLTIGGYMAGGQERDKIAGFASDAATTTAVITKKYTHTVGPGRVSVYWLDLSFTTLDGVSHASSINVPDSIHDHYHVGNPVPVTYVKSRPEYFYIPGTEPTQRDVGISDAMFKYGAIASVACLAGLIGLLFLVRGKDGGAPTPASETSQQPVRAAASLTPIQSRANFGTRRS